jgi:hypothetical protein
MSFDNLIGVDERLAEHPFTDPEHSQEDLEMMRRMARQLVDTYDDPVLCEFVPGENVLCQSDPAGRHFRIYYIQPELLFRLKDITVVGFFGHAVADDNEDLKALIGAAPAFPGPGFLLPTRNSVLLRWCLEKGLRVVQPMTLMSMGLYNQPDGAFLPSVVY